MNNSPAMPAARLEPRPAPWTKVAVTVITCALVGVVGLGAVTALLIDEVGEQRFMNDPAVGAYMLVQFAVGILSLVLVAFAVRRGHTDSLAVRCVEVALCFMSVSICGFGAMFVGLTALASRRSWGWITAGILAVVAAVFVDNQLYPGIDTSLADWGVWALNAAIVAVVIGLGVARGRRQAQHWKLVATATMKDQELRLREAQARHDERTAIARDMHDAMSHRLSLIALHAGVLSYRDNLDAETTRREAETIRQQAEEAVEDLRAILQVLRTPDDSDASVSVSQLVDTARATGQDVTLELPAGAEQALEGLPTIARHAVARLVQEGLTNARKHVPGDTVTVALAVGGGALLVDVLTPAPRTHSVGEPGFGLTGLAERFRLVGGSLEVDPTGPFRVRGRIPLQEGM